MVGTTFEFPVRAPVMWPLIRFWTPTVSECSLSTEQTVSMSRWDRLSKSTVRLHLPIRVLVLLTF